MTWESLPFEVAVVEGIDPKRLRKPKTAFAASKEFEEKLRFPYFGDIYFDGYLVASSSLKAVVEESAEVFR